MRRFQDWPERMQAFIEENRSRAFNWDGWHCALWSLAHVDAITGTSHYDTHRPFCHDEQSSLEYIEGLGGIEAAVTQTFGPPLLTARKAQRGDLVMIQSTEGPALGVLDLSGRDVLILTPARLPSGV